MTKDSTELAAGGVYFGSQFPGGEGIETGRVPSVVGGACGLLICILSNKNQTAKSERQVGFNFQWPAPVTYLHLPCLLHQSFHKVPKQGH